MTSPLGSTIGKHSSIGIPADEFPAVFGGISGSSASYGYISSIILRILLFVQNDPKRSEQDFHNEGRLIGDLTFHKHMTTIFPFIYRFVYHHTVASLGLVVEIDREPLYRSC